METKEMNLWEVMPAIALRGADGECEMIRKPSYEDFKSRLS